MNTGAAYSRRVGAAAAFFFGLGLLWHLLPATTALVRPLTPFMLLVFGVTSMVPLVTAGGTWMFVWALASYAAGFALEAVGVATGAVFGPYEYGTTLGFHVLAVPPIIGFNWVIVIAGSASLATRLTCRQASAAGDRAWPRAFTVAATTILAGALATAFDWVMEPVAIALGYWRWFTPDIPLRNYAAWFGFAAASTAFFALVTPQKKRLGFPLESAYVAIQLAFFAGIRIALVTGVLP